MNDYQSSKLVDILPPPATIAADHSIWLIITSIVLLLALLIAAGITVRSRAFARFQLRRQIIRHTINSRQAAAKIIKLWPAAENKLPPRLLELRFGPSLAPSQLPMLSNELLDILRSLP